MVPILMGSPPSKAGLLFQSEVATKIRMKDFFFSSSKPLIWILWRKAIIPLNLGLGPMYHTLSYTQNNYACMSKAHSTEPKQVWWFWTTRVKPEAIDPVGRLLSALSAHADTKSSVHANSSKYFWPQRNPCSLQAMWPNKSWGWKGKSHQDVRVTTAYF